MTDLTDLREDERPRAPRIPGAGEADRARGRTLAAIHRLHLGDLAQLRALIDRIDREENAPSALADKLAGLEMSRNLRDFGALCGRECNTLLFHHGAEEGQVFPVLESAGSAGLRAVIAKLRAEHEVVHTLMLELDDRARAILQAPDDGRYAALRDTFTRLEAVIRSHFAYEETELEEALGFHGAI